MHMVAAVAATGGARPSSLSRWPPPAVQVVGFLLQRRRFSAPLPIEVEGQGNFALAGPTLPPGLAQFQEALDVVLEALPKVDWRRCRDGDALVQLMVKQILAPLGTREGDATRSLEPDDEQEVFMDVPHHDDYWPGADYFVVSDAAYRTFFYPRGRDTVPTRYPPLVVVRYDALSLHSAPGFCPASSSSRGPNFVARRGGGSGDAEGGTMPWRRVLRTFVRVAAWDPLWTRARYPHVADFLGAPPALEWQRPQVCDGEDVIKGCFDAEHPCERCCDISRGPNGDGGCWAGWMTYQKCCGPASRRWAGCGWRHGADLWGHEYYSLEPPRLHSAAMCQQRCDEDVLCGGWTFFRAGWRPPACHVPLATTIALRRVCILRASAAVPPTPHAGAAWGPAACEDLGGCLDEDADRLGDDLAFLRDVPDPAACRSLCRADERCAAFLYFRDNYVGDFSSGCVLPFAVSAWWESRCLLKVTATREDDALPWFMPLGDVVSGERSCLPAAPWRRDVIDADPSRAIDGVYRREECATQDSWRADFDAEYLVEEVTLWFGDVDGLLERPPRRYEVLMAVRRDGQSEERLEACGIVAEPRGGGPIGVSCASEAAAAPRAASGLVVRGVGPEDRMALCEVEVRLGPIPCADLAGESVQIHSHLVRLLPRGQASLMPTGTRFGEACERRGGSLVNLAGHGLNGGTAPVCVETACAPSTCLEAFDDNFDHYRSLSLFGLRDKEIEAAADACFRGAEGAEGVAAPKGRYFEATVLVYGVGGSEDASYCPGGACDGNGRGNAASMHWAFCAPSWCSDDEAARGAARMAAEQGLAPSSLPRGAEVEFRNVRVLGRWEDVQLDFLVAGFARSGTHSVRGNLLAHPEVLMAEEELTFNWAYLPLASQLRGYAANFPAKGEDRGTRLRGGKGEGVALSPRLLGHLSRVHGLRLVVMVREPVEWLESLYNLRAYECRMDSNCGIIPSLSDVILGGATFADVNVEDVFRSQPLKVAAKLFLPTGRLLLLEFELLRDRPQEFYDRLATFLGIAPFPQNFTFGRYATEDRVQYTSRGLRTDLCSPELRPALEALQERLRSAGEHLQLAQLLAATGARWISRRLVAGTSHCA